MTNLSTTKTDDRLIQIWLHGRPNTTTDSYRRNAYHFLDKVGKPIAQISLEDLQAYATQLYESGLKESSCRAKLNSIKSLFTFAAKLQYIHFNVAAALRLHKSDSSLASRILKQQEVFKLINCPGLSLRDRCLLKFLYATGARISEACRLKWSDFQERDSGEVQVQLYGKGGKVRTVLVPIGVWVEMSQMQTGNLESGVFLSVNGRLLDRTQAHRIIKDAAIKTGVNPKVSAHWLRHCNASHALARGASLTLVRDSLGHSSIAVSDRYLHANPNDSTGNYLGL